MALRVRMQGEKQVIEGEIADLKFYLCEFNPARRNATKHFIIQPCTISLHGNTPEANGMNISLSTSDIRINVSPGIFNLIQIFGSKMTFFKCWVQCFVIFFFFFVCAYSYHWNYKQGDVNSHNNRNPKREHRRRTTRLFQFVGSWKVQGRWFLVYESWSV